ncbi:MAG: YkgJ family cysteine cluster protein [Archangium sp.]
MRGKVADDDADAVEIALAWRRAVTETRLVLTRASEAWSAHGCPGTAECCQLAITKREPWLWPSEWKVIEARLKRDGRVLPPKRADGACPFLDAATGKRCTIYEDRPFGCRTFFCHRITGPAKQPADQTNALLERLRASNIAADSESQPRSILDWFSSSARSREEP